MSWKKIITAAAFIMLLLFCIIFGIRSCKKCDVVTETIIKTKSDTVFVNVYDTLFVDRYFHLPSVIDTFFIFENNIDTLYITGIAYDTIWIDSLSLSLSGGYPVVHDSIFIERIIKEDEKFYIDLGLCLYPSLKGISSSDIGACVGLNFRGGNSIEGGYNFFARQVVLGYRRRIKINNGKKMQLLKK